MSEKNNTNAIEATQKTAKPSQYRDTLVDGHVALYNFNNFTPKQMAMMTALAMHGFLPKGGDGKRIIRDVATRNELREATQTLTETTDVKRAAWAPSFIVKNQACKVTVKINGVDTTLPGVYKLPGVYRAIKDDSIKAQIRENRGAFLKARNMNAKERAKDEPETPTTPVEPEATKEKSAKASKKASRKRDISNKLAKAKGAEVSASTPETSNETVSAQ